MRTPISLAVALLPAMAFAFVPTVDQKTVDAQPPFTPIQR